ncbi:MAG: hypothetical protein Q8M07_22830 [Prosthecobacter sp.]|nr:hypothetical protein [Prosthecobacter sp.]
MRALLHRWNKNEAGAIGIMAALTLPVLLGAAVMGTEVGFWAVQRQAMQGASHAAAISAVTSRLSGSARVSQARAITAARGFVSGHNGVSVEVNSPPVSGPFKSVPGAVEVIVRQPQRVMLAAIFSSDPVPVRARAVAIPRPGGACLLAINKTASGAITVQGSAQVTLKGCGAHANSASSSAMTAGGSSKLTVGSASAVGQIPVSSNITAENGVFSGVAALDDPYANRNYPTFNGCSQTYGGGNVTLFPGVYCGGISLTAGAQVTLNPGIYYLDSSELKMAGNSSLTGKDVTIVFTSSKGVYAGASISSNAVIDLTAPATGPTAGIALFGDRAMTAGTSFKLTGGGTQTWGGALYLPKAALTYAGGATGGAGCTQIVADTVTFTGNSNLALECEGSGVTPMGSQTAIVVE